jgi:hypothetical protein
VSSKRKFWQYEYWPSYVFYGPFIGYWIWRYLQCGDITYFCRVNPGIEFGGVLDYSKFNIIRQIPESYKPKTEFVFTKSNYSQLPSFPFVAKPDIGERGVNVEIIKNQLDWENYPVNENIILQEYIDYPYEFGIFYVHNPQTKEFDILSITGKEFLIYESDGIQTLKDFLENNPRAESRMDYLKSKFSEEWDKAHPKGTKILLEPIGNHNRGTKFIDSSHLKTEKLKNTIHEIAQNIDGFYYGRFDVKAKSSEDLQKGEVIIMEINGANSEPTHIYDPSFNLMKAYKEATRHFGWQYKIALTQPKKQSSKEYFQAIWKRIFN